MRSGGESVDRHSCVCVVEKRVRAKFVVAILSMVAFVSLVSSANALIINGPPLTENDSGYSVAGIGFRAGNTVNLTGFTFQNQGQADTVILIDVIAHPLVSVEGAASN
jgi:hypothetical protein